MISLKPYLALAACLLAGVAAAQTEDEGGLSRSLELPAHKALQSVIARSDTELALFATDGCSGGLSRVWDLVAETFPDFQDTHDNEPPWQGCCVTHDRAYHNAGEAQDAAASFSARLRADQALRGCVIETADTRMDDLIALYDVEEGQVRSAYNTIAGAMYLAVRFGGAPCSGLPWRWGYGYPQCSVLTGAFD
ncbi:hypothetical protein SuNHUV7_24050 (plasmid) [Pseudoseohaeicola sp. NH-UV-7]|uniref:hypothetical protein n=1 Tax=unclassified Sulfitobacter TaxID=196795 RepID=UPI0020C7A164|nr:hypothetical protein [Sulfitobacter sp. JL08]